ncbi:MAG: hypothetical protein JRG82_06885 [Deltaproteobacteria bacterium]|nr:hypothetical protein [Deltaproteobacteria bacterium]
MRRVRTLTLVLALLGLVVLPRGGAAAPLGLQLTDDPDIAFFFVDVSYNAAGDVLSAMGFALTLEHPAGVVSNIVGGTLDIAASIDGLGNPGAGTLSIIGTVPTLGFNSGVLLTGTLQDFGFLPAGGDPLEFLFNVVAGDAAGLYGGVGSSFGVILSGTLFPGTFGSDFDNSGSFGMGFGDVAPPIPEPGSEILFAAGLFLVIAYLGARGGHTVEAS